MTASKRPVILYRAGRTAEGAKASASHTAAIAADAVVTRELTLNGSCASCGEYPACLNMLAKGTVDELLKSVPTE